MSLVDEIIQAVAELPDRTSPDDWPEAMLVTAAELRQILVGFLGEQAICDCNGGAQGDGLVAIPHEPQCAVLKCR